LYNTTAAGDPYPFVQHTNESDLLHEAYPTSSVSGAHWTLVPHLPESNGLLPEVHLAEDHRLRDPELRKIRAMQFVALRVSGVAIKEIAAKFNVSKDTVDRDVTWAIRNGFMANVENDIITELAQKALKVYRDKLNDGSEYVAKHVLDIVVKLGDRFQSQKAHEQNLGLRAYIDSKRDNGQRNKDDDKGGVKVEDVPSTEPKLLPPHDAPGETPVVEDLNSVAVESLEELDAPPASGQDLPDPDGDGEREN
jgi:hypothetical protein